MKGASMNGQRRKVKNRPRTIRLTRFCSAAEYLAFIDGEELENTTDHYNHGKGGSISIGFCFSPDPPEKAWKYLKGIVDCEVCMVLDVDISILGESRGKYVDHSASGNYDFIPTAFKKEYCTTRYSNRRAKLVTAINPRGLCSSTQEWEACCAFRDIRNKKK